MTKKQLRPCAVKIVSQAYQPARAVLREELRVVTTFEEAMRALI